MENPRNIFVSMLFTLVLGNSAIVFFDIFKNADNNFAQPLTAWGISMFVLISSWVDWSNTFGENSPQQGFKKIDIWSAEYLTLLLDIAILYSYFFLFALIDIHQDFSLVSVQRIGINLLVIYLLYFFWDAIHYANDPKMDKLHAYAPSALCAISSLVVFFGLGQVVGKFPDNEKSIVVLGYIALAGVIIFFRWLHHWRILNRKA